MTAAAAPTLARRDHLLLVLAVIGCRFLVVPACPTYDDAFITYRYAAHLAAGQGFVFNPGAPWEPVLGVTTPLYGLLMAAAAWLGAGLVHASLYVNVACDAVTAMLLPRLFGGARTRSIVALVAFAALPALVRITVGGMEVPLFALLGIAAALAHASRRPLAAGALAAFTCLARPEGVLLVLILFVASLRRPREAVRFALPVVVIGGIAIAWLTHVYGTPIPHSVTAKAATRPGSGWADVASTWGAVLRGAFVPHDGCWIALPFVLAGAWRALREAGPLRHVSLWALAITVSYLIARPHVWGWYHFVPLVAWTAWLGVGLAAAGAWAAARWNLAAGAVLARVFVPLAVAAIVVAAWRAGATRPTPVNERVYRPLAEWAERTSAAEPAARILASDIGALGWWWHGTVLDSAALVWPPALEMGTPMEMIEREKPEYVFLQVERFRVRHFRERPDLYAAYEPIVRFSAFGLTDLEPELEALDPNWTQDYVVYRRRAR